VDINRVLRRFRRLLGYHGSRVYGGFAVLHDGLPGSSAVDAYAAEGKIIAVGIRRRGSKQDNCRGTECRETQLQFHVITLLFFSVCLAGLIRVPEILREELHEVVLRRRVQRGDAV